MRWIGLTGGIASGKSTVSRMLLDKGYPVVDADQLARDVVKAGTDGHREVVAAFGSDAVSESGELDRKKIGEIVFHDRSKLTLLEGIIHPRVRALAIEQREALAKQGHAAAFYDVPLLFEKQMQDLFDLVVVVTCIPDLQLKRVMQRDQLTQDAAQARINSQMPISQKVNLADEVILNNNSLSDLGQAVDGFLSRLD